MDQHNHDWMLQQARWRLIGACVLLAIVLAVVLLLFDREPSAQIRDLSIDFMGKKVELKNSAATATMVKPSVINSVGSSRVNALQGGAQTPELVDRSDDETVVNGHDIATPSNVPSNTYPSDKLADRATLGADSAKPLTKPSPTNSKSATTKPEGRVAQSKAGRFIVRIGHFTDKSLANQWVEKLKANGLPAYTEKRQLADGTRNLLRIGPFSDSLSANEAAKKAKALGLINAIVVDAKR